MSSSILPVRRGSDAYALHVTTYERGQAKSIVIYRLGMSWPLSYPMIRMHPADETLPFMFVPDENSLQLVARTLAMEIQMDLGVEDFFGCIAPAFSTTESEGSEETGDTEEEEAIDCKDALKIVFRLAKILPDRNWADHLMGDGLEDMAAWTILWQYAATVYDRDCLRELQIATLDGVRLILGGYQNLVIWSASINAQE